MAVKLTKEEQIELESLIEDFEKARDELQSKAAEIADRLFHEHDEKSDKWKESETGQEAEQLVEAVQQIADDCDGFHVELPN